MHRTHGPAYIGLVASCAATDGDRSSSAPMPGCSTSGVWSCATRTSSRIIPPLFTLPACSSRYDSF